MNKLLGGIGLIIFGISLIIFTIKYPSSSKPDPIAADFQGWIGGILGIIIGIMMIVDGLKEIY
jgi:putative Mn2+ efflux pump MntP